MTEVRWMNSREAGEYARVSAGRIREAAECGDLGGVKVTPGSVRSEWRFTPEDVDAWLERGRVTTGPRRPRRRRAA